jgi:hypothetical protein
MKNEELKQKIGFKTWVKCREDADKTALNGFIVVGFGYDEENKHFYEYREKTTEENTLKFLELCNKQVFCVLKGLSRSGMSRKIDFFGFYPNKNGRIEKIYFNNFINELCGYKQDNNGHLKVNGCGMDMGFSVVANLSEKIYKDYKVLESNWL